MKHSVAVYTIINNTGFSLVHGQSFQMLKAAEHAVGFVLSDVTQMDSFIRNKLTA